MKLQKTRFNAINNDPFFHFLIEDICTMRKKRSYKELINCITTYNFYFYMQSTMANIIIFFRFFLNLKFFNDERNFKLQKLFQCSIISNCKKYFQVKFKI